MMNYLHMWILIKKLNKQEVEKWLEFVSLPCGRDVSFGYIMISDMCLNEALRQRLDHIERDDYRYNDLTQNATRLYEQITKYRTDRNMSLEEFETALTEDAARLRSRRDMMLMDMAKYISDRM
ncbi:hypothetical protein KC887_02405 [Candidatus Kaiserbacteria bacterium]|nr:hypothetical protein [Candidatus Kaiserbacteria bacterium]